MFSSFFSILHSNLEHDLRLAIPGIHQYLVGSFLSSFAASPSFNHTVSTSKLVVKSNVYVMYICVCMCTRVCGRQCARLSSYNINNLSKKDFVRPLFQATRTSLSFPSVRLVVFK